MWRVFAAVFLLRSLCSAKKLNIPNRAWPPGGRCRFLRSVYINPASALRVPLLSALFCFVPHKPHKAKLAFKFRIHTFCDLISKLAAALPRPFSS